MGIFDCMNPSKKSNKNQITQTEDELDHNTAQWSTHNGSLCFNVSFKDQPSTHRGILSVATALYVPLGFIASIALTEK